MRNVSIHYGDLVAVDDVTLSVEPGSVLALLGPSGSGKSSLLRALAGLEPLAAGQVLWDGIDLSTTPVHRRNFGFVFQDAQLFSTMDVGRNIAYGLGKLPRHRRQERVREMLHLVGLQGFEGRKVTELSGGQAQRVALARSLAPSPRALLLDEPLSALDRSLREHLADELARILREVGTTAIHVTHDQDEASTVADTVAVMDHGRLLQRAEPDVLWRNPASRDVARFLGFSAFLTNDQAAALGWVGRLGAHEVLGIGPRSLELHDDGVPLPVTSQGFALGEVEIGVRLPDGQGATLTAAERTTAPQVRVRLVSGAVTPA
ncbi:ABC transporter ATP-binding protein [Tessaracoccus antarcticus]|uniref:ABC-type quaternary amine transporter n=2 Tax=Tessaracoccus antarcticus TaxID=2479848 RepID=A0A3M0GER8_9ACTN|nr:ABC transporter ATP-binding protein [Tessaracoccus antarcticus]